MVKKKKVAIITIESENFGNRLQNFALQEVIKKLGFDVETIRRKDSHGIKNYVKKFAQFVTKSKGFKFRNFEKNIRKSKHIASVDVIPDICVAEYEYFITGSDQVWNPNYSFVGKSELLYGVPYEKSIAYAASFGVDSIPSKDREEYIEGLKNIKYISVREYEGVELIYSLIGNRPQVVLDPTLLMDREQWRKFEKKPDFITEMEDYIFVYMLGHSTKEKESFFKEHVYYGKKVIDVNDKNIFKKDLAIGPSEFLWLVDHAETIITDSFHGTVFSFLFHKKILLFNREDDLDMSSRLNTLLREVHLVKENWKMCAYIDLMDVDYMNVDRIIEKMRRESTDFLKFALQ